MGKASIILASLLFLAFGVMAQHIPVPATTSQATNLVTQDSYMSPARVGDFWYDVVIPFILANSGSGIATNAIANNNGVGTNVTIYGTLTSTNLDGKIKSATNGVLVTASNIFSIKGSAGGVVPAPATTSQATNLVVQDVYMSPARVGDFWYDVVIPYITSNGGGGTATNAIANNNGAGTNLTVYGTLTSTNLNSLYDTNNAAKNATNNFGNTVSVNLTNSANLFAGTFTNGIYYGNGKGLTNLQVNISGMSLYTIQTNFTAGQVTISNTNITTNTAFSLTYTSVNTWAGWWLGLPLTNGSATFYSTDSADTNAVQITILPSMLYMSGLASTNGNYPNMTVGAATIALGGWPVQWSWASITNQPVIPSTNGFVGLGDVTNVVTNQGYVTVAVTNGLATINFVTNGITTATNNLLGTVSNQFYSIGNQSNYVTASVTNGLATTNYVNTATNGLGTNAATLIGILPQYPTVQVATNAPFTNAVLISPDGTNRVWSSAYQQYGYTQDKYIGVTNYPMVSGDHVVYGAGTNQVVTLVSGSANYECLVWDTNITGSIIITNAGNLVLGSLSRSFTNGQKFYGNTPDGVIY
jgi:hypothetical protein